MNEDKRISVEYAPESFEASLIRAAKSDGPGSARRANILVGLGVPPAIVSEPPPAMSAAPAGTGKAIALKWVLVGALAAVAPIGAWLMWPKAPVSEPAAMRQGSAPPAERAIEPGAIDVSATDIPNTTPVVTAEELPIEGKPPAAVTLPRQKQVQKVDSMAAEAPEAPSLSDELKAVQRARTALSAGNSGGALRELDAYRQAFPSGRLSQEATVLRIEALVKLGQRAQAKALAKPFLEGKSPYAARVRSLVGE